MESGFFIDFVRTFLTWLDSGVYWLIGEVYGLITRMTEYRIFDATDNFLTDKIYTLLSIFMLFKVSFSFINYLINPDSFTDKEKGVQKIILNVVIMFILLVISPWAFGKMWELQDALIKEDVIGQFVFEDDETVGTKQYKMAKQCTETSTAKTDGDYISLMVLRGFYHPYDNVTLEMIQSNASKLCESTSEGTPSYYLQLVNASSGDMYIMNYTIIVSTAVGVVTLLILIGFAMDVGLRVIKLSFLQLIAPIPIVSYVDPSSHKNGMFIKWLKEVGATWVSVFVRLFALFFAIRVIQELGEGQLTTIYGTDEDPGFLINVFLIIGALMFAKQLPKLISDITGIKLDGGFNLNPLKKIENEALGGKELSGGIKTVGKFTGRTAKTLGGLAGAGLVGAARGIDNKTGNIVSGKYNDAKSKLDLVRQNAANKRDTFLQNHKLDGAYNRIARDMASIRNDAQSTLYGVVGGIPGAKGLMTAKADRYDKQVKEYDDVINLVDTMMNRANKEMIKYDNLQLKDSDGNWVDMHHFKVEKERLTALRGRDTSKMSSDQLKEHLNEITKLQAYVGITEKKAEQAYVDAVNNNTLRKNNGDLATDVEIKTTYDKTVKVVSTSSDATVRSIDVSTGGGLAQGKLDVSGAKATVTNSDDYRSAQARKNSV